MTETKITPRFKTKYAGRRFPLCGRVQVRERHADPEDR